METIQSPEINIEPQKRVIVMLGARMDQFPTETSIGKATFSLLCERSDDEIQKLNSQGKQFLEKEIVGGWSRMRAIEEIYKEEKNQKNTNLLFLITGVPQEKTKNDISLISNSAKEATRLLIEKYKIPKDNLISTTENITGNTFRNASDVFSLIKNNPDFQNTKEIEILTNDFHMLRSWLIFNIELYKSENSDERPKFNTEDIDIIEKTLIESADDYNSSQSRNKIIEVLDKYFKNLSLKIKPLVVEDILFKNHPEYVEKIFINSDVKKTRNLESAGVLRILKNEYI